MELVARDDLHPALSDLLIRAAREIHGSPGLFRNAGEYPAPLARDFPISADAERYYKSGEQFLYKRLPFWLASLVDRLLVVLLPLLVVIVPATRLAPAIYRWRIRSRIYRWYGALMAIEREMRGEQTPEQKERVHARLDEIVARRQRAAHAAVVRRPALRPARPRRRRPPPPGRRRGERRGVPGAVANHPDGYRAGAVQVDLDMMFSVRLVGMSPRPALDPALLSHLISAQRLEDRRGRRGSGLAALDGLLGGGWPRAALCEISGRRSSGRTAILYAALARRSPRARRRRWSTSAAGSIAARARGRDRAAAACSGSAARPGRRSRRPIWCWARAGSDLVALDLCDARPRLPTRPGCGSHGAASRGRRCWCPHRRAPPGAFAAAAVELAPGAPRVRHGRPAAVRRARGPRACAGGAAHEPRAAGVRGGAMRLACVYVPQLALQAALRRTPEARERRWRCWRRGATAAAARGKARAESQADEAARHRARRRRAAPACGPA